MVKKKQLLIACGALLIFGVAYYFIYQSDTAKIKRQLKALSENMNKAADENKLASGLKTKALKDLFADPLILEMPSHDIVRNIAKQDLPGYAMTGRMQFKTISLTFYDISIVFPETGHAEILLTARFAGEFNSGEMMDEINELACTAVKMEDDWLFNSIKAVDVLEK